MDNLGSLVLDQYWQHPLPKDDWLESLATGRTLHPTGG